jgi:hypothetical protein
MATLKVARPFCYSSPDGNVYELGIAVYDNMSDEFCTDWWVNYHTEAAVLARGLLLFQWRDLLGLDPTTGTYGSIGFRAKIFLDPALNGEYTATIEPNWPPIFVADCDGFPMDDPIPDARGTSQTLGFSGYRRFDDKHRRPITSTIKVFPGDGVSPPVTRAAPPLDRSGEQHNDPRFATPPPQLYPPDQPNDPKPIVWPTKPWDQGQYTWRDPRQDMPPAKRVEQPQPSPDDGRAAAQHYADEARTRVRLNRALSQSHSALVSS